MTLPKRGYLRRFIKKDFTLLSERMKREGLSKLKRVGKTLENI
jgi:hypothetical protein